MKMSWKMGRKEKLVWSVAFLTGFFLGIALVCLFADSLAGNTGFLDASGLLQLRYLEPNRNGLFLFCLRQRISLAAVLVLLSAAGAGKTGIGLFLGWCGVSAGAVLTTLSMNYGIKGLFLFLGCLLPQQLVLIPGYLMLLCWCSRKMERKLLLVPVFVILTGCFLEGYLNPAVLKAALRLF